MGVNLVQNVDGSMSLKNEIDGKTMERTGGVPVGNAVNASASVDGTPSYRGQTFATVPLNAAAGVGASLASWKNTDPGSIFVNSVILDVTTGSSASCTCKVDSGSLATSSGVTLIAALDLSNVGTFASGFDGDAGSKPRKKVTTGHYINVTMVSGSATGLVGTATIGYFVL